MKIFLIRKTKAELIQKITKLSEGFHVVKLEVHPFWEN